ncbi:MAG: Nicotinate dehydrogenase subunit [Pseudomonadota bacterium]|jgi:CO/xanthine dehydrogenase Mo-binding subunit
MTALHMNRREWLLSAGALVVGVAAAPAAVLAQQQGASAAPALPAGPDPGQLDSWIAVLADGSVQAAFGKMDMGHGLEVAIAQVVAEELDVALASVTVVMGDTARTCNQGGASGSTGIQMGARPLRNAAAEARRLLLEAAARELAVSVGSLQVQDGIVRSTIDPARQVSYAQLVGGKRFAAPVQWNGVVGNGMDVRGQATPKPRDAYRLVGQSVPRRDLEGKVFGTSPFVTDIRVPGLLHARMVRPPRLGATLATVDESSIRRWPAARVVREGDFLAVVADDEWSAVQASRALRVEWTGGLPRPLPGDAGLHEWLRSAPVQRREEVVKSPEVDGLLATPGARVISAEYEWPLQSHASMGPACAVADVRADRATVWTGSQKPHAVRDGVAKLLGLSAEAVRAIWVPGPGSYGRNDAGDAGQDAAWLSKRLGRPVRVQYMRHEGTGWDPKGPACVHRARATLAADGRIAAYEFVARGLSRTDVSFNEADPADSLAAQALGDPGRPQPGLGVPAEAYGIAHKRYAWETVASLGGRYSPLRTSHLRDPVGPEVHFGSEQFIDELAHAAGADPVAFRLRHLADAPRDAAVLRAVADKAGWQVPVAAQRAQRLREGGVLQGRGVAYAQRAGTIVAVVAEVEVEPASGRVRVPRVTVAHDCGLVVNPRGLVQTIEGNVVQGLSRILFEEVRFDHESVRSVDWATYPILGIDDCPDHIDVVLLDSTQAPPSGAGEPTLRVVPAAVANAFFAATGVRLRRAPFTPERVRAALAKAPGAAGNR